MDCLTFEDGTDMLCRNVGTYKSTLHQILEKRRFYLQRDGRQKSRVSVVPNSEKYLLLATINTAFVVEYKKKGRIVIIHNVQFAYTTVALCDTWCIQMRQSRFHYRKSLQCLCKLVFNETVAVFTASNEFSRFLQSVWFFWALIMN